MDICMSFLKNMKQQPPVAPTAVNTIMIQEQIHNLTLSVNKV